MNKKRNLIEWAMEYHVIPLTIALVLFVIGIAGLFNMPRNEFPEFTIRQGVIMGIYPGASSRVVEEQLTKKVEEYLFSYNEVDKTKTYSYSRDGMMYIFVEVSDKYNETQSKNFWNKLKLGMLEFRQQVPKEVAGFFVNSDFGSTSALLMAVESTNRPYKDLLKNVEYIESELRHIEDVAKISHTGNLEEQVAVYIDNNKLLQNGVSVGELVQSLQKAGAVSPGGLLLGNVIDRPLHINSFYKTESEISDQIIRQNSDGSIIRVRDIATIKREYDDHPASYVTSNGTKAIIISLEMIAGKNIVQFGKKLEERMETVQQHLPSDIKITKLANQPEVVDASISHFMKEFAFALIGVIIVALLLLPFRVAAVAAATIPVTIAATLSIMYMAGIELDTVTLAALIVVLGIVVDDPIVVIDNHIEKLDHGMSVWEAAKQSAVELFPSVFTATLAISATFVPLMFFMTGVAKDFISVFPITIIIALTLSLLISMVVVPFFNTLFIKKGLSHMEKKGDKDSFLDRLQKTFNGILEKALKYYRFTTICALLSIVVGIVIMAVLPQQLFPKVDRNQFAMEISLPNGYNLRQTDSVVKGMERILKKDKRIINYTSFIGASSPRFHIVYAPNLPSPNYAQILLNTESEKATEEIIKEYSARYSESFPAAYVRMKQLNMVNASAPIEVRISGDSINTLKQIAGKIMAISKKHKEIIWTRTDFENYEQSLRIDINASEAARFGITKQDIAAVIASHTNGIQATQIWEGTYALNVKVKSTVASRNNMAALMNLDVFSPTTKLKVPLRQIANLVPEWNEGQIVRRNSIRTLTVRMDVSSDAVANKILSKMEDEFKAINLPSGYEIHYGGEYELQEENIGPMAMALGLSIILIFLILLWHFKQLRHAVLSITTMPLSILGASFGLLITGYPFGFTSFIGLLALCGIVVRNGVILIDHAEELRHNEGKSVYEAAKLSAERRMRPIFLTSAAAAVGVTPMIISGSSLWGPLGTVICFGLLFSMILTLFALPTLYWLFFRRQDEQMKATSLPSSSEI